MAAQTAQRRDDQLQSRRSGDTQREGKILGGQVLALAASYVPKDDASGLMERRILWLSNQLPAKAKGEVLKRVDAVLKPGSPEAKLAPALAQLHDLTQGSRRMLGAYEVQDAKVNGQPAWASAPQRYLPATPPLAELLRHTDEDDAEGGGPSGMIPRREAPWESLAVDKTLLAKVQGKETEVREQLETEAKEGPGFKDSRQATQRMYTLLSDAGGSFGDSPKRTGLTAKGAADPQMARERVRQIVQQYGQVQPQGDDGAPGRPVYTASTGEVYDSRKFLAQNGPVDPSQPLKPTSAKSIVGVDQRGNFKTEPQIMDGKSYRAYVADLTEAVESPGQMYGLKEDKAGDKQRYWGECVSLCKALAGVPATENWLKGRSVQSIFDKHGGAAGSLTPGTAVAIFGSDGKYHMEHSGIFIRYGTQELDGVQKPGFYMLNQYPLNRVTKEAAYPYIRFQFFNDSSTYSHNASRFHVIYTENKQPKHP